MPGTQPRRIRRQPQRTCVACREVAGKRTLLRLVRTSGGGDASPPSVEIDPTGKRSGRGAYVHLDRECVRRAVETGAIARALKLPLDREADASLLTALEAQIGPAIQDAGAASSDAE